jgi:hypothetical protein
MRVALSIAPNDRTVIRAAIRLLVHLDRAEEAFEYLRRHPRTKVDPWLLSQDASVGQILKKTPSFLSKSRRMLRENSIAPGHLTELASAIGSLDVGDLKGARKLHRFSLIDPTDNVVAQVEWLRQRDLALPSAQTNTMPGAVEARFLSALREGDWPLALDYAFEWQEDEPYSPRPALAGSFLATSVLPAYELGSAFANAGLRADPSDALLLNNLVVAKARDNQVPEAMRIFSRVRPNDRLQTYIYLATRGLLRYATGDESGGIDDYRQAAKLAEGVAPDLVVEASWIDTQTRWGSSVDKDLLHRIIVAVPKTTDRVIRGVLTRAIDVATGKGSGPIVAPKQIVAR